MTKEKGISGNALKIIAAAAMVCDHVGLMFFPGVELLRIIGRLAFPVFAYMIAEGCRYTRNRKRYFGTIFILAVVCQVVYYLADRSLYMCVLVTFSASIPVIFLLQKLKRQPRWYWVLALAASVAAVWQLNRMLTIDYGFWGCMLPVFAALFHDTGKWDRKEIHVLSLGVGLVLLALDMTRIQWYALFALPLLLAYSGRVGKRKMKYFFYVFYPAHLVLLQGLAMVLK